jgi:hypothetical protein
MIANRLVIAAVSAVILQVISLPPSGGQTDVVPTEVVALFDDINDIDKLRVINALKLSDDQIEQIISALKQFQGAYNKVLADSVVPPVKEIAKEIKETRARMLKGASVPSDLDDKVKKLQDAYIKKRDAVEYNTLKGTADAIKKILSSSQVATAASLAKKATPSAKGEDDKFFNLYVMNVFLRYTRIVLLLEDVRKARSATASAQP